MVPGGRRVLLVPALAMVATGLIAVLKSQQRVEKYTWIHNIRFITSRNRSSVMTYSTPGFNIKPVYSPGAWIYL